MRTTGSVRNRKKSIYWENRPIFSFSDGRPAIFVVISARDFSWPRSCLGNRLRCVTKQARFWCNCYHGFGLFWMNSYQSCGRAHSCRALAETEFPPYFIVNIKKYFIWNSDVIWFFMNFPEVLLAMANQVIAALWTSWIPLSIYIIPGFDMMQKRIVQIIMDSFGAQFYGKAMDCLKALREESIKVGFNC